ncbi:PASTA domain-containing protein [Haliovirga abyssi]|uniref:PASTA domain-containing protein n=1 Tax=Haliovirga abyssi TaxID=2996794 RepID=A0AAU9D7I2_9FUSO|nr:PASTA domain-containing protein [Haliovirga abyssi]BDU50538.1 hypothetical protein HLVA_11070 [Haliovirga abyssi]
MKKAIYLLTLLISISIFLFLGSRIFVKLFFNEYYVITPSFIGMKYDDAFTLSKKMSLNLVVLEKEFSKYNKDVIFDQIPKMNTKVKKNRAIKIWVSKGKIERKVPNLFRNDLAEVKSLLIKNGIEIENVSYTHSSLPFNSIIACDPAYGTILKANQKISLLISLSQNTKNVYMPDIIGINFESAKKILEKSNLIIGKTEFINDDFVDNNIILDSSPRAGEKLHPGSVVNLTINQK